MPFRFATLFTYSSAETPASSVSPLPRSLQGEAVSLMVRFVQAVGNAAPVDLARDDSGGVGGRVLGWRAWRVSKCVGQARRLGAARGL